MPYTNTQCMNLFLRELSRQYPEDYILLIVDNAAWHRHAKRTKALPNETKADQIKNHKYRRRSRCF